MPDPDERSYYGRPTDHVCGVAGGRGAVQRITAHQGRVRNEIRCGPIPYALETDWPVVEAGGGRWEASFCRLRKPGRTEEPGVLNHDSGMSAPDQQRQIDPLAMHAASPLHLQQRRRDVPIADLPGSIRVFAVYPTN